MSLEILVSAFEPFGGRPENSSGAVAERLRVIPPKRWNVKTVTLPVGYKVAFEKLKESIEEINPRYVIALGEAESRRAMTPEKVAINYQDAMIADNIGVYCEDQKLDEEGKEAYFTKLPIKKMIQAALIAPCPAEISLSAGSYVCNDLFYRLLKYCDPLPIKAGFIHLPILQKYHQEPEFLPDVEDMAKGLSAMLDVLE